MTSSIAAARLSGWAGGTRTASVLSSIAGTPPTLVATIGTRAAIASRIVIGVPSECELKTKTSNAE